MFAVVSLMGITSEVVIDSLPVVPLVNAGTPVENVDCVVFDSEVLVSVVELFWPIVAAVFSVDFG